MRRTILLTAVASLTLALLLPLSTAAATTTPHPTAGTEDCQMLDPGRVWWPADNVLQVRGEVDSCAVTGDQYVAGTETVVINYSLNFATGSGGLWGTWQSDLAAFDGGFEGTWSGSFHAFAWTGTAVGAGYGELEGWQARLDLRTAGPMSVDGFVFSPGDRD